jgi:hypothetical protein
LSFYRTNMFILNRRPSLTSDTKAAQGRTQVRLFALERRSPSSFTKNFSSHAMAYRFSSSLASRATAGDNLSSSTPSAVARAPPPTHRPLPPSPSPSLELALALALALE